MKKNIFISPEATIKEALKKLDKTAEKTLFVVDKNHKLLGTLTDGDVRRHIIKTGSLNGIVKDIYNPTPIIVKQKDLEKENIKNILLKNKVEVIPIVDANKVVVDYITWSEFFSEDKKIDLIKIRKKVNLPVVIMAGGKGTRLEPFTYVLPKPLIPIGKKTMVEHIIDNFRKFGVTKFILTLNYKGELIEAYFKGLERDYEVDFVWEEEFLGTAGSLKLLEDRIEEDFIVSNCDILINADFGEIVDFHKKNNAVFTSITAIKHYRIPYGVVNIRNGGKIENIEEKPEHTFQINTGVYVLNKSVLEYIPENEYFDMPQLIRKLLDERKKVLAYPVNESDYIDVGQWEEYREAVRKLEVLRSV